ncbi:lipase [Rhodococcus sp. NPDC058514]|uniref:lipase n=1 Tax=unclassified Rhodococcus (in: high G+C Gram-positive bacteria) TaxID=192944 RepID=UPI003659498D
MINAGRRHFWTVLAATALTASVLTGAGGAASADTSTDTPTAGSACGAGRDRAVLLVHDLAANADQWRDLANDLDARALCGYRFTYGVTDPRLPVAGLAALEGSANELAAAVDALAAEGVDDVDVVAVGAGALVAQRYLQDHPGAHRVRSLTAAGAMWDGTNVAELGAAEDLSRRLGTYDAILAVERPLIDPLCGGCRQLVRGSDFLTELRRAPVPTPGVTYTNILSASDGLVVPFTSGAWSGMTTIVIQDIDPSNRSNHFQLTTDPLARALTVAALLRARGVGEAGS